MGTPDVSKDWVIEWWDEEDSTWNPCHLLDTRGTYTRDDARKRALVRSADEGFPCRIKNGIQVEEVNANVVKKVDLKITNKPQLSQLPYDGLVYASKGFEYGCVPWKYKRGNYLIPTPDLLAAFDRLGFYIDAAARHLFKTATSMNRARGCTDGSDAALKSGAYAEDPESGLPHLVGAVCSMLMAIQQAVDAGLLPAELGQPWIGREPKVSNEKV